MRDDVAFYCTSSELYFPGAVALVNSLRILGHTEPIYVLGCGLTGPHRDLLSRAATVLEGPPDLPPYLLKTRLPLERPARVRVLIDVDMVATRPLAPLIRRAAEGRVIAVKDNMDRFVPEWGALLDLGEASRRPYVSSGLVILGGDVGEEALRLWNDRQDRVEYERSWFDRDVPGYPFRYIDQDVLNAVLCTRVDPRQVVVLDQRLAPVPPFRNLRVTDASRLRCSYEDGSEPYVLHQFVRKPWLEPMYHSVYSQLLARLWVGDDLPIAMPDGEVPRRMRPGLGPAALRRAVDAWDLARWYVRDVIPERLGVGR